MPQLLNQSLSWICFSFMNMKLEAEGDLDLPARINLNLEAGGVWTTTHHVVRKTKAKGVG